MLRRPDGWRLSRYSAAGFWSLDASDPTAAFVSAAPEGSPPWRSSTGSATVSVSPCYRESAKPVPLPAVSDDCGSVASRRVDFPLQPRWTQEQRPPLLR